MGNSIKIGTRKTELALWQANSVRVQLEQWGYRTEIIEIVSNGDENLKIPMYQMGIVGVFTRNLDIALLERKIDIAVHSLKDVPTEFPESIVQVAVLKREDVEDVLVYKGDLDRFFFKKNTIATGSLRRQSQWLSRHPDDILVDFRGSMNMRLKKLESQPWDGAIFSKAGLNRIGLLPKHHLVLDWMVPPAGQGSIVVMALNDVAKMDVFKKLNDENTSFCVKIERDFMKTLEGGCSLPIGVHVKIEGDFVIFKGLLSSIDGKKRKEIFKKVQKSESSNLGLVCAQEVLIEGGNQIIEDIKNKVENNSK